MKGIFLKPETVKEALKREDIYLGILQGGIDPLGERNQSDFDSIIDSNKSEQKKLDDVGGAAYLSYLEL